MFRESTYVPDHNFRIYLNSLGVDFLSGDSMKTYQMETIISLNLAFLNISNLTGISSCTNLQYLDCRGNYLIYLDLSNNSLLSSINCSGNTSLSTIDLRNGNNSNLTSFIANNTPNLNCVLVDNISYFLNNFQVFSSQLSCNNFIYGCTNPLAINYEPSANIDDGSCNFLSINSIRSK